MLTDCHNHLQKFSDPTVVLNQSRSVGVNRMIVNGTSELDWDSVAILCREHSESLIPAFGLHPWEVPARSCDWLIKTISYHRTSRPGTGAAQKEQSEDVRYVHGRWRPTGRKQDHQATLARHLVPVQPRTKRQITSIPVQHGF